MNEIEKEEQRKRLIKIGIYVGVFVIAFILLKIENLTSNKNNQEVKNEESEAIKVVENIKSISEDNYEENIYLSLDDDAITLNFQKSNNVYIGVKKYHGENITFIKKDNLYYSLNQEEQNVNVLNDFVDFNYDKTFTELSNIKKLLEKDVKPTYYDGRLLYKFNNKDVISIYNNYNNTALIDLGNGYITLDIYHENDNLDYILIDITSLYNKVNNKEYEQVVYKISFKETSEEDISWLDELLK